MLGVLQNLVDDIFSDGFVEKTSNGAAYTYRVLKGCFIARDRLGCGLIRLHRHEHLLVNERLKCGVFISGPAECVEYLLQI